MMEGKGVEAIRGPALEVVVVSQLLDVSRLENSSEVKGFDDEGVRDE